MQNVKNWVNDNKKKSIVIAILLLLIFAGMGIAIFVTSTNSSSAIAGTTSAKTHFVKDENGNVVELSEDTNGEDSTSQATDAGDANSSSDTTDGATLSASDNGAGDNSGTSGDNGGGSQATTHTHTWTPVYTTVHHAAVTHTAPVYGQVAVGSAVYCKKHGCKINYHSCPADPNCMANTTTKEIYETRQTGTKTVTDSAAYDEQVIDHYSCSCGATK